MHSVKFTTLYLIFFPIYLFAQDLNKDSLRLKTQDEKTVYVRAARFEKNIEEVSISMEVLRPALIANKGLANLEQAVNQSPGVFTMDGQVSIRGGGGYAYGAGSRVLLVWNGVPMLSPDIGDVKWNAVPMEHAEQIEIIKGASSVLYGSGALNGIIAMNEKDAPLEGTVSLKVQNGIYGNPPRASMKWWDTPPTFQLVDVYAAKRKENHAFTLGVNVFRDKGYREGDHEQRARIHGTYAYFFKNIPQLKAGLSFHVQAQEEGVFILWRNDSMCLQALENTLSEQRALRLSFDPYLLYISKNKVKHALRTRYYVTTTGSSTALVDASFGQMYYTDYQASKKFKYLDLSFGATSNVSQVTSYIFGNHLSKNFSLYHQAEWSKGKLDLQAGLRLEYCQLNNETPETNFNWVGQTLPVYPILRFGGHYALRKSTHLRASFGQGIRFPAVAERYISTSVGGLRIFQNPDLLAERGWAAELGLKQVVVIGAWKALLDVAGFINAYDNMTEFAFGVFKPDTMAFLQTTNPGAINYLYNWVGFQAQNAERARITGIEFSMNSTGKIGEVEVLTLLGYTYMNPLSLNTDTTYLATFSDTTGSMLKYRFKHLAKADIELNYKKFGIGISGRYNSFMRNIDLAFEEGIIDTEILVGMAQYRAVFNKGVPVFDLRFNYAFSEQFKCNLILNNFTNAEYVTRPGAVQAPRNFVVQLQYVL
ncbi:MAG: TonB-dependent receptor [Crocinitomicaceae bacterium]|nr:TonB-dependent receptor [Crocinitomicaceae bacterium]